MNPRPVPDSERRALVGALGVSLLLHLAAVAGLAVVLTGAERRPGPAQAESIAMVLIGGPAASRDAEPVTATAAAAKTPSAPLASLPPVAAPGPVALAPWSDLPIHASPPAGFHVRASTREGLDLVEARDLVRLGEAIEARVRRDFPDEPDEQVQLRPAAELGYPLDLVASGVEGNVLVWFAVSELGDVTDVVVVDGDPALMEWVEPRVGRLVQRPALRNGRPVAGWVGVDIFFTRDAVLSAPAQAALERR